jgi:threonine dehydratase
MSRWPITFDDVLAARDRIRPHMPPTPLRAYAALDAALGNRTRVRVKLENHNPTNAFKVRNALSVMVALSEEERRRGVVAATRGNHGLGLAWAGHRMGVSVSICVPAGNNPEKNDAMRGLGAEVIEEGRDYDEAVGVARRLVRERRMRLVHATDDRQVIAGAATITLEILEEAPDLEALVFAVGGGSQAVGGLTVARHLRPSLKVYGVQAERAAAIHDSWHAGRPIAGASSDTFADGLATRGVYEMTFGPLREGLAGFVTVTEAEIAEAIRLLLRTTHNLVEGAGAAGLAGLIRLGDALAGKQVGVVLSGSNIDSDTLRRVLTGDL